jgi:hypothetical protein
MIADIDFTEQVTAGMAWLDAFDPDWVKVFAVDLAEGLHMDDCNRCVLGYVLGSYWDSRSPVFALGAVRPFAMPWIASPLERAGALQHNDRLVERAAAPLGFTIGYSVAVSRDEEEVEQLWAALGEAWKLAINKRLADAGLLAEAA